MKNKIAIIVCTNNVQETTECLYYVDRLHVPDNYELDIITIQDASSMAEAYDEAMRSSDAKYKIYIHQDVFLIDRDFLQEMIDIFMGDESIGLIGCIGNTCIPENALAGMSWNAGSLLQNQVPNKLIFDEDESDTSKYTQVDVVDGLFIATQYDIPWRKDIFDGWDFYDISQCMEMKRHSYKVVVPNGAQFWCYHDNLYSKMLDFNRQRVKFIKEYQDIKRFRLEDDYDDEKIRNYEQFKIDLMKEMEQLIDNGKIQSIIEIFKDTKNKGYLFLREYEIIGSIYHKESLENERHSIYENGENFAMAQSNLHRLKYLIKKLEYDAAEADTVHSILEQFSDSAIKGVLDEYCVWKDKVYRLLYAK